MYKGQQWQGNHRTSNAKGRNDDDMRPGEIDEREVRDRPDGIEGLAARKGFED